MTTGKTKVFTKQNAVGKVMSMLFNTLPRFIIVFLLRSKDLLILWLHSPPAVILEPQKIKSVTVSIVSPSICHEAMGPDAMIFVSLMLSFKPAFSLSSFTFIKRIFSFSSLSAIRVVLSAYLRLLIFLPAILIPACASSSLVFLMMYSAYMLNKQSDDIQPWCTPFLILNQSSVLCSGLIVASWPAYRSLRRQVRWSDIPRSFRIFYSWLWGTQRLWSSQWSRSRWFSGTLLLFLCSSWCWQLDLVPLPFLNTAWTPGSFWFVYYWSLAWRILSITLLECEMSGIVW